MNERIKKARNSISYIVIVTCDLTLLLLLMNSMSLNNLSSVDECQSDPTILTTASTITLSSSSIANSSLPVHEFTTERIARLLKKDSSNYKVIKNSKSNLSSVCWQIFGLPAKKSALKEEFEQIPGYVSCQSCFQTYTFTSSFGTRILNAHSCVQKLSSDTKTSSSSVGGDGNQMKLEQVMKCYKQVQLSEKEINLVKDLTCKWLCKDMRPFSVIEDIGLRNLLQKFISIGATYGEIDVKSVIRSAHVASLHTYKLADDYRAKLKDLLKEPYENKCICISPDMWSDPYKQLSYMGISITIVDGNFFYKSFDLCCQPYVQKDHTGESILISIRQCLEPFGLIDFDQLQFVSDRGPNLVSALRNYDTLFCYPHRLNNVLKCSFFQSQSTKKQIKEPPAIVQHTSFTNTTTSTKIVDSPVIENDNNSSLSTDDEEKTEPTIPIKKNKSYKKQLSAKRNDVDDPRKLKFDDLDPSAQEIIKTITKCKDLVQFVKKSGCNKDIQSCGGVALQQSTVIRWLSLIDLLESIVRSYTATKRVLIIRKQHCKLNGIDEEILKQLIRLLKPFKHVLKIIQSTNTPSLYMVFLCTLMLKKTLASFDELMRYQTESSKNNQSNIENNIVQEIEDIMEHEGIKILRLRILDLLNLMFELDVRHYTATLLHPRYRQMKECTKDEREQTYRYIRKRMSQIIKDNKQQQEDCQPPQKKKKIQQSILQQYEDDSDYEQSTDEFDSSGSESYAFNPPKIDELSRYLSMNINKTSLTDNPLDFWRSNQTVFPILSKLARQIHCIPASSAAVERQFSGAGIVINERRTALDPDQVNNILFIRSMENMKL